MKYKLVKKYPQSPPVGSIAEFDSDNQIITIVHPDKLSTDYYYGNAVKEITENSEFWQLCLDDDLYTLEDVRKILELFHYDFPERSFMEDLTEYDYWIRQYKLKK